MRALICLQGPLHCIVIPLSHKKRLGDPVQEWCLLGYDETLMIPEGKLQQQIISGYSKERKTTR